MPAISACPACAEHLPSQIPAFTSRKLTVATRTTVHEVREPLQVRRERRPCGLLGGRLLNTQNVRGVNRDIDLEAVTPLDDLPAKLRHLYRFPKKRKGSRRKTHPKTFGKPITATSSTRRG